MKKLILLLVSFTVIFSVFSQPVITSSINLSFGDSYSRESFDSINFDPGPAGANQTWDFAEIAGEPTYEHSFICVDPSTTPYADSSAVAGSNLCTVGTNFEGGNMYSFYSNSNSSQVLLAAGLISDNDSTYGEFNGGLTMFEFPLTFNDSFNYAYDLYAYNINEGFYFDHDSSIVSVVADAYGTIITPTGTFQNALRLKSTEHRYLWMWFEGAWVFLGDNIVTNYLWVTPTVKVPVMIITTNLFATNDYVVDYLTDYNFTTGIETNKLLSQISIYPNPADDNITVELSDEVTGNMEVSIVNLMGQQLSEFHKTGNKRFSADISNLPSGVYFIRVNGDAINSATSKFIKR